MINYGFIYNGQILYIFLQLGNLPTQNMNVCTHYTYNTITITPIFCSVSYVII